MPPDYSEQMRDAQFAFDRAMGKISKATAGVRRDLPVELDKSLVPTALEGWEEGREALNSFFASLNDATGMKEMRSIPPYGPDQKKEYGRSERRYLDLKKKIKLCQNRGGPTLSQAWGQLMVSGKSLTKNGLTLVLTYHSCFEYVMCHPLPNQKDTCKTVVVYQT